MNSLVNSTSLITLSVATSVFLLVGNSNTANAEIYKWRNNRGQIQYSDKPPVAGFTKADRHEIVNSLQSKDLCVEPTAKTVATASTARRIDANFFGGTAKGFSGGFNGFGGFKSASTVTAKAATGFSGSAFGGSTFGAPSVRASSTPIASAFSPLKATSSFGFGGRTVSVFGSPVKTAQASFGGFGTKTGSLFGTKPAQLAVAPKPTIVATAPTAPAPAPAPQPIIAAAPAPVITSPSGPNILQSALMPAVDISRQSAPMAGESSLRIQSTAEKPSVNSDNSGQFRVMCGYSHMSNDDPIIYPNQQGASHNHTFFGNTSANFKTSASTLSTTGNSTCSGGIMNRSAYWVPTVIDTATNTPIRPDRMLVYYKTDTPSSVATPPKGLRMIAGDAKSTTPQAQGLVRFTCNEDYNSRKQHIPACGQGQTMEELLIFPTCWDGKNLDSPDHKSHMAYTNSSSCPASHPVKIPTITFNVYYKVNTPGGTANWKLASDNYSGGPGGNSFHGDWMNGWDETFSTAFTNNCLKKGVDCHAHLLGDGRMFF